ncbi:conserved hypothetical protein [Methylobacterium sp. 4-46]|uniref:DUF2147 domain-containing protein n=1 Tax=unclassified Methylobacterium TaxID=2615210 RepID=UPI000152CAA9|nr:MULTISPECIES: DUF2147 domain-containing protein [Methylobacterium]ACA18697.1 conserved hypothetical protein [Methylobacterium sp. 4-46]WFT77929.1 DUF2147 domain-containing protein [Methylobacterium nodulans]
MYRGLIALLALTMPALAQPRLDPSGTWLTAGGDAHIRITRCGQGYCSTVAKVLTGEAKDVHNPDPALRARSMVGVALSTDMRPTGEGWEGSLYNFRDGKTYTGKLAVKGPNALELAGCVLGGLICKRQIWSRVN